MGTIYPKGVAIGVVNEVVLKKNPVENEAVITAAVDFNTLETVAVIIGEKI
jgi:cell shape-determining protein MreC